MAESGSKHVKLSERPGEPDRRPHHLRLVPRLPNEREPDAAAIVRGGTKVLPVHVFEGRKVGNRDQTSRVRWTTLFALVSNASSTVRSPFQTEKSSQTIR